MKDIERIGEALIARGVSEMLVRRILSDKRLPQYEKAMLFLDIYHRIYTAESRW